MSEQFCLKTLATKLLSSEWEYNANVETLVLSLGSSDELSKLNLIEEGNYLSVEFKKTITVLLGEQLLENVTGPFGDDDLFSGINQDDGSTSYFIKLCGVSQPTVDQLLDHNEIRASIKP